jgi:hypothetical protein
LFAFLAYPTALRMEAAGCIFCPEDGGSKFL